MWASSSCDKDFSTLNSFNTIPMACSTFIKSHHNLFLHIQRNVLFSPRTIVCKRCGSMIKYQYLNNQLGGEKMNELNTLVKASKLPNQLKEYFTNSESIKEVITVKLIKEIEDLYIYFNSLYSFDKSEYSAYTITSLKRCKDLDSLYFYLKKVLETNLKLQSKDNECDQYLLKNKTVNRIFQNTASDYFILIDKIYEKEKDIDMAETYKALGKIELIVELIDHNDFKKYLIAGNRIIEKYIKDNK